MIAELPREISQPEHVVEEIVHGGLSWRVVASYGAELRFCRFRHQPRAEYFCPCGARRQPGGHPSSLVPGRELAGRLLHRLAVVGPEERRVGASHVHVQRAAAEEARLREDGDAREPLISDAEPALHRRVAVPGPQRPVVGGCRGEVPGLDISRGVGCFQGCVPSVRHRMVHLRPLRYRAECPHCGGPQVKVLPWVVVGAGGLGAGKTSGAGTRGVSLNAAIGGGTGYSDTNRGKSSNN